jgi:hypothetical protein
MLALIILIAAVAIFASMFTILVIAILKSGRDESGPEWDDNSYS